MRCNLALWDNLDQLLFVERIEIASSENFQTFTALIPGNKLIPNRFKIGLALDIPGVKLYDVTSEHLHFDIIDTGSTSGKYGDKENGIIVSHIKWLVE